MKKLGFLLILAFTTFFSSCEKDLYEEAIIRSDKGLKIRKISLNDVSRSVNPELYKRIDQLKIKQEKIHARLVYDSINNFYYDDENGKVIEDELGVKSYTFPVYRENSDGKIENVLFSKNQNGEFEVFLVKYSFTDEQLKFLSQYEISQQTAVYTNITANKTIELCIEFWEWISYPINEGELTGNFGYTGEWILKKKICEDYNEYLDPGLGNTTGVEPVDSGSGDGGGIGNAYTTPVPVVITHEEALRRKFFVQQILTNSQETFFNSLSSDIKNSIFQYLADNSDDLDAYSQEAIDLAVQIINALDQYISEFGNNSDTNSFAYEAIVSITNGGNADFKNEIILDATIENNQKIKCVYDKLKSLSNSHFKDIINSAFGSEKEAQVRFKAGNIPEDGYLARTYPSINGTGKRFFNIVLDNDFVTNASTLEIAITLIHELFHAELAERCYQTGIISGALPNGTFIFTSGIQTGQLNNQIFNQLVQEYITYIPTNNNPYQFQHNLFNVLNYRNLIISDLTNINPLLDSTNNFQTIINNDPFIDSMQEVINNLSWLGLEETNDYNLLSPENIANIEHTNNRVNQFYNKNCN